jgi:hypothetical protein
VIPLQTDDPSLKAYLNTPPKNAVTRLQEELEAGRVRLRFDGEAGGT